MDRSDITTAVGQALREVLTDAVPTALTEEVRLIEDLHLDSTGVLELLMALEDRVGLEVDMENLDLNDLKTVGTLADYVGSTLQTAA